MNHKIVSTEDFWTAMCNVHFVRQDLHTGAIGNTVYKTKTAPEEVEDFIENQIEEIKALLAPRPPFWWRVLTSIIERLKKC